MLKSMQINSRAKNIKRHGHSIIWVIQMVITLETIHRKIQQVKAELNILRNMLGDEGELTDGARKELQKARKDMSHGKYVSHEDVVAQYG